MRYSYKKITGLIFGTSVGLLAYPTYNAYQASITPSTYEISVSQLGFKGYSNRDKTVTQAAQQEAILKILHMSGSLQPQNLWQDLHKIKNLQDPAKLYNNIYPILVKSKADQTNPYKFNAKLLRKNLFNNSELTANDSEDLILYLAQNAFARKIGAERSELATQDWMSQYSKEYLAAANDLHLTGRHYPHYSIYDEAWVFGASRIGILTRLADFKYTLSSNKIQINGLTKILAGARELWAEIDGITPATLQILNKLIQDNGNIDHSNAFLASRNDDARTVEGQYMCLLAKQHNINLNTEQPFITYADKTAAGPTRYPGRTYANYVDSNGKKLTETLLSQDLTKQIFSDQPDIHIVDTLGESHKRPTTSSTSLDAATTFIENKILANQLYYQDNKNILQKEFIILAQSNNPHTERQAIDAQRQVNLVLRDKQLDKQGYKIIVDGIGFSNKQDVATINSEFAILVAEKWKLAHENAQPSSRSIDDLMFQTRAHNSIVPEYPTNIDSKIDLTAQFKHFFDEILD